MSFKFILAKAYFEAAAFAVYEQHCKLMKRDWKQWSSV